MAVQVMYWSTARIYSFEHCMITHWVGVCFPAKWCSTWYKTCNTRCLQACNTEHTNTYGHMEGLLCGSRNSAGASHIDFSHSPQGEETASGIGSDRLPAYRWEVAGLRSEPRSFCLQSIAHSHCPRQLLLITEKRGAWAMVLVRAGSVNVRLSPSFFHLARKATRSQTTQAVAALPLPRKSLCVSFTRWQVQRWHGHAASFLVPSLIPLTMPWSLSGFYFVHCLWKFLK